MTYDEIIQQVGKRILKHIYYINNGTTTYVNDDNIGTIKLKTKADLLGTAIKECEIEVKEQLLGQVYVQVVATYQSYTQTKTFGPYNIKDEKYDANKKTYNYVLYDNIIKTMVDYTPLENELDESDEPLITFPCSVYDYFVALNTYMGFTTNIATLPNGSQILSNDIYNDINYTFRDVYNDLAIANGILLYVDDTIVKKATLGTNTITITDDILKNANIQFGEHYGPINSIVLSRSADSDKIYTQDQESITQNGLCEFKIEDNIMLNDNNRSDYLSALATQLFGIEYDIYDTELVGYGDVGLLDQVDFETGNNEYSSYIFNNEITLTSGYKQVIYNDMPKQSETDYKTSSETDKMIKQAYIIVDKQNSQINSFVGRINDVADQENRDYQELGSRITQTEDNLQITILSVRDVQSAINNGVPKVATTLVTIDNNGIDVGKSDSKVHTTMTNNEFKVGNATTKLAFIGYDEVSQTSKAEMDNLKVNKWLNMGVHRVEKFTIGLNKRTGHFYDG